MSIIDNSFKSEIVTKDPQIGETWPLYGAITKFISEIPNAIIVEINGNIRAQLNINTKTDVELLKEYAFEPAIFISTVTAKEKEFTSVSCSTVIIGQRVAPLV